MLAIPPTLSVTVALPRRACVLDVPLALSRHGLLAAKRLSDEFDLWLVREFWQILDNTEHYVRRPDLLTPEVHGLRSESIGTLGRERLSPSVLQQWEFARMEKDLAGLKLFWIGDATSESLLSPGVSSGLLEKFEALASALDNRASRTLSSPSGDQRIFIDCFRDAAALAAALIPHRGFILTCLEPAPSSNAGTEPRICEFLRQWGVMCRQVDADDPTAQMERTALALVFARAGLAELIWAGLRLAVVHLVLPGAVLIPAPLQDEDLITVDLWDGAEAFWYPFL